MSKQVIFVLHGVGDHKKDWSKPGINALKAFYKEFKLPGSFDDRYQVIEILYGEPFIKYWKKHDEAAKALGKLKVPSSAFANAILSLAKKAPKGKLRSHTGDVYLYLATDYNEPVTLSVINAIDRALIRLNNPIYSIIAHSLGTRVSHDTMQRGFSNRSDFTIRSKARVHLMIANVTRLASFNSNELKLEHGLKVFPNNARTKGTCQHYINVNHPLDPICAIRQYDPVFRDHENYHEPDIASTDITSKEIHSLKHYCSHPAVAAAFFNQTLAPEPFGPDPVSASTIKGSLKKYRKKTLKGKLRDLHDHIQSMEPGKFKNWKEAIQKITDIREFIKDFKT